MKFGILYNRNNMNIGDDIQAYATARFLPQIDYFIDRETIDSFTSSGGEPVAVIMNAWYMWRKWNWPPSKYIYPLMVGFHYADHQLANQWYGSPIKYQFLEGIGGDYLNAYGPVGCRDMFTLHHLQELGINAYFSGCITLTLPQMPEKPDKGQYICVVDTVKKVREKLHKELDGKIEVRDISQLRKRDEALSWEERKEMVKELLTTYQNARCVVTRRLHCALPCLAMGVPVLLVRGDEDDTRFEPYYDLLHRATVDDFLSGNCDYDYLTPPENKSDYKQYRESLIKAAEAFVAQAKNESRSADELKKTAFTEQELKDWRHDVMKSALEIWLNDDHRKHEKEVTTKKEHAAQVKELNTKAKSLEKKAKNWEKKAKTWEEKTKELEQENKNLSQKLKDTKTKLETLENERLIKTVYRKTGKVLSKVKRKLKKQ